MRIRAGGDADDPEIFRQIFDVNLGAQNEFPQSLLHRAHQLPWKHRQHFLGRRAQQREYGHRATLRAVKAGERGCTGAELFHLGRKLALKKARGIGSAKRQHAQSFG